MRGVGVGAVDEHCELSTQAHAATWAGELPSEAGQLTATWPGAEQMGARPVGDSLAGILWAATLPDDGPRGGFFRDSRPHPW